MSSIRLLQKALLPLYAGCCVLLIASVSSTVMLERLYAKIRRLIDCCNPRAAQKGQWKNAIMNATAVQKPRDKSKSAALEVLTGNYELLVLILSKLPATKSDDAIDPDYEGRRNNEVQLASVEGASGMRDLLLAQGVCRNWRDTIARDETLQRLLFFLPARSGMVAYIDWQLDIGGVNHYIEVGKSLLGDEAPHRYPSHWGRNREDAGQFRVYANPLLATKFAILRKDGVYFHERLGNYSEKMQEPDASWRKMLISQPAIRQLSLMSNELSIGGETSSMWRLETVTHLGEYRQLCEIRRAGLRMERLFGSLVRGVSMQMASIQGSDMWEERWEGLASLEALKLRKADQINIRTLDSPWSKHKLVLFEINGKPVAAPIRSIQDLHAEDVAVGYQRCPGGDKEVV